MCLDITCNVKMSERTTEQLKYLEFVQSIVTRMHDASISMKRFAITAFALGGALARYLQDGAIIFLTMVVVVAFWLLDAKYLQIEREYRTLYDCVRIQPATESTSFKLNPEKSGRIPLKELASWSTSILYVPLILLLVAVWLFANWET